MSETTPYRVLIIEDEALVARELKSRLTNMGYEVAGIAYGAEGVDLARETQPDLLLTDIHLKDGEDGIAVARRVLDEQDIPVVFLTAYSDDETVSRAKSVTPYGYIIKPVENRELQIVIEMALYKHNMERELRQTQQLLQTALTCIGSALIFVDENGAVADLNADARALLDARDAEGTPWYELFGLDPSSSVGARISRAIESADVTKLAPFVIQQAGGVRLVDGIVGPREDGAVLIVRELSDLRDSLEPVSSDSSLDESKLTPTESSLCQLLVAVAGDDQSMERAGALLNQRLRSTDLVSPYGDAELAVSMPYTSVAEARKIAGSLLTALRDQDEDAVFSMGLAYTSPSEQQPFELFRRAAWALEISRDSGGNRVVVWSDDAESPRPANGTSSDNERGYHNVVLLWNVMNLVVNTPDREVLAHRVSEHVRNSFELERVAVLEKRGDTVLLLAGVDSAGRRLEGVASLGLNEADFNALRSLSGTNATVLATDSGHLFQIAPDVFVDVRQTDSLPVRDLEFLETLVQYAGGGLANAPAETEAPESAPKERRLLYQSARMQSIIDSVQLVAPTDATVLIIGESGTGKESIARAIHDASPRASRPFTIVDCGAVVGSLIESELFGHVKGAFTGADRDFSGRLKEADGGTVLLDEVGELPLDVQVKLLRFVQEHEIVPVGGSRFERVDTRIIAATNRDLTHLIETGEFREDLYYRLNVFTIETPPLREREGDLLLLARHFLDDFSRQYGKPIEGFTPEAEAALMEQRWPGNIRELMNVVNRAVILCRGDRVSNIHLGLFPEQPMATPVPADADTTLEEWSLKWIDFASRQGDLPPVAVWLEEDLISLTLEHYDGVLNRAAQALSIPESTLRRKVGKARGGDRQPGRPPVADTVQPVLSDLFSVAERREVPVLDLLSTLLIQALESRHLGRREAASIMGVSLPTYRKLLAETP